jgi:hypothetical protein
MSATPPDPGRYVWRESDLQPLPDDAEIIPPGGKGKPKPPLTLEQIEPLRPMALAGKLDPETLKALQDWYPGWPDAAK